MISKEYSYLIPVSINDAIVYKKKLWFIVNDFNGLVSKDIATGDIEFVGEFADSAAPSANAMIFFTVLREIDSCF